LAGADAHCTDLARNATGDKTTYTWHAYLSAQERPGQPAINARDRIGKGPWYNAAGLMIAKDVEDLHSSPDKLKPQMVLNELGQPEAGSVWNSHGISGGCSHESLARSHGAGLFYCFAIN